MRKNNVYALTLLLLLLFFWLGYLYLTEYLPTEYENSTFVELPKEEHTKETENFA